MLTSYAGGGLQINLSTGNITKRPLAEDLIRKYVGGKGLGTRLLCDEVKPRIDPLSPENKLIFTTGPATGTLVPNKGYILTYKSPLTGIYASSSSGGSFGTELKQAGYDFLIIGGRSEKPVYLWIDDEKVEIRDGKHLWGRDTFETNYMVKKEIGDEEIKVARIGPSGEKLVRFAGIFNDYSRAAGRCGAGAVMGSKNLKAIAVRGTKSINVANIDELLEFLKGFYKVLKETYSTGISYPQWGTPANLSVYNQLGVFPTRYWHKGTFAGHKNINRETIRDKVLVKSKACHSCPVNCAKLSAVKEGLYSGALSELDYETVWSLGGLCENDNIGSIVRAIELCDKYGIDAISAGNIIAFAMECYERGIITTNDTEGINLVFGNHEAIVKMVEKIAMREGLGDVLAEGVSRASKQIGKGAEEFAIHVKGLEPPGFDPRALKGTALAFAVADRGACHLTSSFYTYELRGMIGKNVIEGKAAFLRDLENRFAAGDSMIFCRFFRDVYFLNTIVNIFPPLIGIKIDEAELQGIGEQIVTLARAFSVREGLSRKDDSWPERFFKEPIEEGAMKGMVLNKDEFNKMLDEYYELRGWDRNGIPTEERLRELKLSELIPEIKLFRQKVSNDVKD